MFFLCYYYNMIKINLHQKLNEIKMRIDEKYSYQERVLKNVSYLGTGLMLTGMITMGYLLSTPEISEIYQNIFWVYGSIASGTGFVLYGSASIKNNQIEKEKKEYELKRLRKKLFKKEKLLWGLEKEIKRGDSNDL